MVKQQETVLINTIARSPQKNLSMLNFINFLGANNFFFQCHRLEWGTNIFNKTYPLEPLPIQISKNRGQQHSSSDPSLWNGSFWINVNWDFEQFHKWRSAPMQTRYALKYCSIQEIRIYYNTVFWDNPSVKLQACLGAIRNCIKR